MRWTCLAIRPPRRFVAAPIPPLAGGYFSIPARINAVAGAPWKPAARSTRCSAIARVDDSADVLREEGKRYGQARVRNEPVPGRPRRPYGHCRGCDQVDLRSCLVPRWIGESLADGCSAEASRKIAFLLIAPAGPNFRDTRTLLTTMQRCTDGMSRTRSEAVTTLDWSFGVGSML